MKQTFIRTISGAAIIVFALAIFSPSWVSAQDSNKSDTTEEELLHRRRARALEGSWTVETTIRNCTNGNPLTTFAKMVTFMRGGTAQEDSVGTAPLSRSSAHGVWSYEGAHNFSYALQFFRFNADGTYGTRTVARWQVEMETGDNYTASAAIQIFNPAGVLVATGCATETATRFE